MLRRQLSGLAELHVLVDLSLHLDDRLAPAVLRRHADKHEAALISSLPGISAFAYTVADVTAAFPLVRWPEPGLLRPLRHSGVQAAPRARGLGDSAAGVCGHDPPATAPRRPLTGGWLVLARPSASIRWMRRAAVCASSFPPRSSSCGTGRRHHPCGRSEAPGVPRQWEEAQPHSVGDELAHEG